MKRYFVVVSCLLTLTGCSIEEPDTSSYFEPEAPAPSGGIHSTPTHVDPIQTDEKRPTRSIRRLVDLYATLRTNVAGDKGAENIRALMSISTFEHAASLEEAMQSDIAHSADIGLAQGGEVVAIAAERAGDEVAVYAIVRFGRYDSNGALIGDTRVAVYSVGLRRTTHGRFLVNSWQEAK